MHLESVGIEMQTRALHRWESEVRRRFSVTYFALESAARFQSVADISDRKTRHPSPICGPCPLDGDSFCQSSCLGEAIVEQGILDTVSTCTYRGCLQ